MATYKSLHVTGQKPVVSVFEASGGAIRFEHVIEANLQAGDVIYLGDLPANRVQPVEALLIVDDLDAGSGLLLDAGILNADKTAIGAGANDLWINDSTAGQNGGVTRNTTNAVFASGASEFDKRPVGVVVAAAAATPQMVGKKIVLSIPCQA